jgi:hypothetical protein
MVGALWAGMRVAFSGFVSLFGDLFRWFAWAAAYRLGAVNAGSKAKTTALKIREKQIEILARARLDREALLARMRGRKRDG